MKVVKNNDKKVIITPPPQSRVPIETPDNLFTHHVNMVVVGKRGSGKSVFISNYLRMLKEAGKLDRLIMISATAGSNYALLESFGVDENDIFDPEDKDIPNKIIKLIDEERDDWVQYLNDLEEWKQYQKILHDDRINVNNIDPYYLLKFSDEYGNPVKPESKYGHRPIIHCFLDDCQSTPIFRNRKFLNCILRQRHMGQMPYKKNNKEFCGAIGISFYTAVQNLKSTSSGIFKALRNNATQCVIVGKTKDVSELDDLYESVGGEIDKEQFMKAYDYATSDKHGTLVIDLHPKKGMPYLRKNMNEMLYFET